MFHIFVVPTWPLRHLHDPCSAYMTFAVPTWPLQRQHDLCGADVTSAAPTWPLPHLHVGEPSLGHHWKHNGPFGGGTTERAGQEGRSRGSSGCCPETWAGPRRSLHPAQRGQAWGHGACACMPWRTGADSRGNTLASHPRLYSAGGDPSPLYSAGGDALARPTSLHSGSERRRLLPSGKWRKCLEGGAGCRGNAGLFTSGQVSLTQREPHPAPGPGSAGGQGWTPRWRKQPVGAVAFAPCREGPRAGPHWPKQEAHGRLCLFQRRFGGWRQRPSCALERRRRSMKVGEAAGAGGTSMSMSMSTIRRRRLVSGRPGGGPSRAPQKAGCFFLRQTTLSWLGAAGSPPTYGPFVFHQRCRRGKLNPRAAKDRSTIILLRLRQKARAAARRKPPSFWVVARRRLQRAETSAAAPRI